MALGGLVAAMALVVVATVSGPASADVWSSAPFPADFRSEPTSDAPPDIDAGARSFADVDNPGPIEGQFGCGDVEVLDDGPIGFQLFDGEILPTRWTSAQLCRVDGDALILDLYGETTNAAGTEVVGTGHARFVRGSESSPFVRVAIDLTDGRCFSIAPSDGLYAGPDPAQQYLLQGWNFAADPSVNCLSRLVPASTTSTTSTTTSTSTPTTTSAAPTTAPGSTASTTAAGSTGAAPAAAVPVSGTASYAG